MPDKTDAERLSELQSQLDEQRQIAQDRSSQVEGLRRELGTQQKLAKEGQEDSEKLASVEAERDQLRGENDRLRSQAESLQNDLDSHAPALKLLSDLRAVLKEV